MYKRQIRTYNLPVGGHVIIENGQKVKAGEVIVKIPRAVGTVSYTHLDVYKRQR